MDDLDRVKLMALEVTSDGVVITDTNGAVVWVNKAVEALSGYSRSELIGNNPRIFKSGHQAPEVYDELWKSLAAGKAWSGEIVNKRKDGSLYYEEMTINPLADDAGVVTHFVALKRDISTRVRAEMARDKLLTLGHKARDNARDSLEIALCALADATDLADPNLGLHGRRVGELACRMAVQLELNVDQIREVRLTGLVHDFGKTGVPASGGKRHRHHHALRAAALLDSLPGTEKIQAGIQHHHEHYDGSGFPDGLKGLAIPLSSRIVAAASAYDNARYLVRKSVDDSLAFVERKRGSNLDPRLVDVLRDVVLDNDGADEHEGSLVSISDLRPGMTLVGDMFSRQGALLYPQGTELTNAITRKLQGLLGSSDLPPFARVVHRRR